MADYGFNLSNSKILTIMAALILHIMTAAVAIFLFGSIFCMLKRVLIDGSHTWKDFWNFLPVAIVGIALSCALSLWFVGIWNTPHHGHAPTIRDVPKEAHIDTTYYINKSDTTMVLNLSWND